MTDQQVFIDQHDRYDQAADWMHAHGWAQHAAIYGASYSLCFGLIFGFMVGPTWFLLLVVTAVAVAAYRVYWHGFLRHLDRKYPLVAADLPCMVREVRHG